MRESIKSCTIVAVGGFTSEAGKTTLMSELLRAFPGWEAIKMTRGHYRSCGKDPHACCVSHLLSDEPMIRSGRARTYAAGKDTGRYWDAGASNVHWVIVTDAQVGKGIEAALARVRGPGVFVEGNSFQKFLDADFSIMCARAGGEKIKSSARRALPKSDALYLFDAGGTNGAAAREEFVGAWRGKLAGRELMGDLPLYTRRELPQLIARLQSRLRVNGGGGLASPQNESGGKHVGENTPEEGRPE